MKGIILAGGSGTRLYPSTLTLCKQLLPIYDKPMIYYPLSVLMLAQIQEVLIVSTPKDIVKFQELFQDGSWLGMNISYCIQEKPEGLAQGLILASDFIKNDDIALILGDNIFYGQGFTDILKTAKEDAKNHYASIFSYHVKDPERFGVAEISKNGEVLSIEEKPQQPKSNYAVTGLYFYDNQAIDIAKNIKPSQRGELEITDVNIEYLKLKKLKSQILGRGFAWVDTGTHDSLIEASSFVQTIELRQGYKIACLEEIAFRNGWIDETKLLKRAKLLEKSGYGNYLQKILQGF
ncbi:glucose-1-phosphate thymidylyltransferase RfbA [Campylobacter lari]|uniref:glucose-1-phosphate thymidylyltransferase RfbA n=1 Tax=Campylobacter lari TaxID=201 RepID=UPI0011EACF2D|nr:glucose-1-phosphate thymidylyltransferase RfbA [Campylobacter lari]EAH8848326.1 glucose-1-phosphate thymidylyltransferase [Campylobacter lari]EHS0799676.1 glucose-1-phosphate thymidylyltransferase RfbA [Campylobacter lari]KAB0589886.1 glucose-1-phosphate thymidylyltransferase RfbA [Campylobacter lari subsp. concheus]MPC01117.1 glucose-1-phosphate thymidylyltransferase RfbA [Campylobacter lari]QEL07262.1 glucose-1-phosphate thymidylyltransferase, short form [Campylobacter lari subsp. concheu